MKMTIGELKKLSESEDKVEFKEGRRNYPFNGGSHKEQADRRKCFLGYVVALYPTGHPILRLANIANNFVSKRAHAKISSTTDV